MTKHLLIIIFFILFATESQAQYFNVDFSAEGINKNNENLTYVIVNTFPEKTIDQWLNDGVKLNVVLRIDQFGNVLNVAGIYSNKLRLGKKEGAAVCKSAAKFKAQFKIVYFDPDIVCDFKCQNEIVDHLKAEYNRDKYLTTRAHFPSKSLLTFYKKNRRFNKVSFLKHVASSKP